MNTFHCKTKIYSGEGALNALQDMKMDSLLLVTDPFFAQNGMAQQVIAAARAKKAEIFDRVAPDPDVTLVAQGVSVLQKREADTVVALGGGSAMDCAKAMIYFSGRQCRLIAIPTTSGSGSEVTDFAVLTHDGVKHPLVDKKLLPDAAILDPRFLKKLPKALIADTGFDVLAHALEAYVATNSDFFSRSLAAAAFSRGLQVLERSFSGDLSVRQQMHEASTMAGLAFSQAGLGLCHALSHSLGGVYHVPHGRLNAILLPAVVGLNANGASREYAQIARAAGLAGSADVMAVRSLKNALTRLRSVLQLPATLQQAGIAPRQLWQKAEGIITAVLQDPCCATNPIRPEPYLVRQVLEEVAGRG